MVAGTLGEPHGMPVSTRICDLAFSNYMLNKMQQLTLNTLNSTRICNFGPPIRLSFDTQIGAISISFAARQDEVLRSTAVDLYAKKLVKPWLRHANQD